MVEDIVLFGTGLLKSSSKIQELLKVTGPNTHFLGVLKLC